MEELFNKRIINKQSKKKTTYFNSFNSALICDMTDSFRPDEIYFIRTKWTQIGDHTPLTIGIHRAQDGQRCSVE